MTTRTRRTRDLETETHLMLHPGETTILLNLTVRWIADHKDLNENYKRHHVYPAQFAQRLRSHTENNTGHTTLKLPHDHVPILCDVLDYGIHIATETRAVRVIQDVNRKLRRPVTRGIHLTTHDAKLVRRALHQLSHDREVGAEFRRISQDLTDQLQNAPQ